jgi:hypothetical protein
MTQFIRYHWTGDNWRPLARFAKTAREQFETGEEAVLERIEARSPASHNHYFKTVQTIWESLPEDTGDRYPTPDHLRKAALIRTGYRDERSIVCASRAEAQRLAAFIRPIDDYAIVVPTEAVVTVYTAKSQSQKAMGAKVFQESKAAVLDWMAELIGVDPQSFSPSTMDRPAPNKAGRLVGA